MYVGLIKVLIILVMFVFFQGVKHFCLCSSPCFNFIEFDCAFNPPLCPSLPCLCLTPGNASPLAIRATSYCVPCEGQSLLLSRLPLGALVTPLAKQKAGEVRFGSVSTLTL